MGCTSQRENLSDVFENYGEGSQVVPVDIYDALDYHKDQYLYFNTDTHWAPLGAYWAYTAFCQAAGQEAAPLSDFPVTSSIEDFTGYLYAVTGESCLGENPDRIDFYDPGFSYTIELSYDGAEFTELSGMYARMSPWATPPSCGETTPWCASPTGTRPPGASCCW